MREKNDDRPAGARHAYRELWDRYRIGKELLDLSRAAKTRWDERRTYTVTLSSVDPLYLVAHEWVLNLTDRRNQRGLEVFTNDEWGITSADPADPHHHKKRVIVAYKSQNELVIHLRGHRVKVRVNSDREDGGGISGAAEESYGAAQMLRKPDELIFSCDSQAGQVTVIQELEELHERRFSRARRPKIYLLNALGNWNRRMDVPARELESVVLPTGQLEGLVADLEAFLASELENRRRGVPFHRGYLLEGPPGTGKTSIAKALAYHFKLDLWYAPLGGFAKDIDLINKVSEVTANSLLLLEDVDTYHAVTNREDDGRLTLSALLNALDGVATPHGLITVLTTNNREVIDPAVVRPGRVDWVEHVGYVVPEQARRLYEFFYRRELGWEPDLGSQTSTAELLEIFKRHLNDPLGAELALRELCEAINGVTAP